MAKDDIPIDIIINVYNDKAKQRLTETQHSINRLGETSKGADGHIKRLGSSFDAPAYKAAPGKIAALNDGFKLAHLRAGMAAAGASQLGTMIGGLISPASMAAVAITAVAIAMTKVIAQRDAAARRSAAGFDLWQVEDEKFDAMENMAVIQANAAGESLVMVDALGKLAAETGKLDEKTKFYVEGLDAAHKLWREGSHDAAKHAEELAALNKHYFDGTFAIRENIRALNDRIRTLRAVDQQLRDIREGFGSQFQPDDRGAMSGEAKAIMDTVIRERGALIQAMGQESTETIGSPEMEAQIQRNIDLHYQWAAAARTVTASMQEQAGETGMMFAADAYNAYADALDRTVSLNQIFAGGFDRAMRNVAASSIRSVGQRAAIDGAYELAKGFAALAIGNPMYSVHFKAAAMFGAIALAAGAGSGLMSVAPGGGAGGGGSGRGGRGGDSASEGRSGPTINVTVIGNPDFTTKRAIAQWVAEIEAEAG